MKIRRLTEERETTFDLSYQEDGKTEGSRNQDSTVVILKHCILLAFDFNRQPVKIRNLEKKQLIVPRTSSGKF